MLAKNLLPVLKKATNLNGAAAGQISRFYHHDDHWKMPSMNELPVPQGSWEEANRIRQRKYNMHLIGGIGFFLFSLTVAKQSGLFFLNFSPPEKAEAAL